MPSLIGRIHDLLRRAGYEVIPLPVARLLRRAPDLVLDVGANEGQFTADLRRRGYRGRVVSFEPIPDVFEKLQDHARGDRAWELHRLALGVEEATLPMHVSNFTASSSLLPPSDQMGAFAGFLEFESTVEVPVRRLDAIFDEIHRGEERVVLKVDTQGYEQAVIAGAEGVLDRLDAVMLELAMIPLYEGESPVEGLLATMRAHGFAPAFFAPAFVQKPSRRWLQADVVFVRDEGEAG